MPRQALVAKTAIAALAAWCAIAAPSAEQAQTGARRVPGDRVYPVKLDLAKYTMRGLIAAGNFAWAISALDIDAIGGTRVTRYQNMAEFYDRQPLRGVIDAHLVIVPHPPAQSAYYTGGGRNYYKTVAAALAAQNLRPATLWELLAFAVTYPTEPATFDPTIRASQVVAFNSVVCNGRRDTYPGLDRPWDYGDWFGPMMMESWMTPCLALARRYGLDKTFQGGGYGPDGETFPVLEREKDGKRRLGLQDGITLWQPYFHFLAIKP